MSVSPTATTPLTSQTQTAGAAHKGHKAGGVDQDSAQQSSTKQVASETTQTNPNGTITTIIAYTDGTTQTTTQAAPVNAAQGKNGQQGQAGGGPTNNLLDTTNLGQNAALLKAQEQASGAAATSS